MPPEYRYFSIVPLDAVLQGVTIENAKYPLRDATVTRAGMVTISNEAAANQTFSVEIRDGRALVVFSRFFPRFVNIPHKTAQIGGFFYPHILQYQKCVLANRGREAYKKP